jgi:serine protease Do
MKFVKTLGLFVAAAALSSCTATAPQAVEPTPAPVLTRQTLFFQREDNSIAQTVKALAPSVVGLAVTLGTGEDSVQGLGTGFFVDETGYLLTNHHVAGEATAITVVLNDGTRIPGKTVWSDSVLDMAVVKTQSDGPFTPVTLGSLADRAVGDPVVAIGTPLDMSFQHTVTAGIISGLNRTLQVPTSSGLSFLEELIQTDASINPGNSGGPLVTLDHTVIGINTVKVEDAEGMGFAIPADLAQPIVEKIVETGSFITPYVGLTVIDGDIARYYGREVEKGLSVLNVDPQGPAYAAGIRTGDVLTAIAGQEPTTVLDFRRRIYAAGVGQTLDLTWQREGENFSGTMTLTEKPQTN